MGAPTCPEIRHTRATKKPPARTRAACRSHATGHVASALPAAYMWSIMSPQAIAALRRPWHGVALAMLHGANHGAIAGRSGNSFTRRRSTTPPPPTSTQRMELPTVPARGSAAPPRAAHRPSSGRPRVEMRIEADQLRGAGQRAGVNFLQDRTDTNKINNLR